VGEKVWKGKKKQLGEWVVSEGRRREGKEEGKARTKRTLRLEKLNDGPNGDVLEGLIGRAEESNEVEVKTSFGLGPDGVEGGVVVGSWRRKNDAKRKRNEGNQDSSLLSLAQLQSLGRVEGWKVEGRLTFRREVSDSSSRVSLDFDGGRVGERDEDFADSELEEGRFEVVCKLIEHP